MFAGKPIIGLAGGIGSGKSLAAKFLGEMGCKVIDSDAQVRSAYDDPAIQQTLLDWWGPSVFLPDGSVNRQAIGSRVFTSPAEREKLEQLLHPWVAAERDREMSDAANDPRVLAFVWDTPLLFEKGLNRQCDAVIFIDTDRQERVARVRQTRQWDEGELARRENFQWGLDKKREFSDYVVKNVSSLDEFREMIRGTLSQVLSKTIK